jgi:glycosyltransferase involved in cell wall biosynthesis
MSFSPALPGPFTEPDSGESIASDITLTMKPVLPDLLTDLNLAGDAAPALTVIVPTRNEAPNIEPLLERLGSAFAPLDAEIIIADDSDDQTPEEVTDRAASCPVRVRLLHRGSGSRRGGLSSAVVEAARHARGDWVLVMDGDLQHPPEAAALLARTAMRHDCDIVVGTRYAAGGVKGEGLGSTRRVIVSSYATQLVKDLFPRRLAMVSDPLSGLFAFRRASVDLGRLRPTGFKILLEILVRNPVARVAEVAYCFEPRAAGASNASIRQGFAFLRHVVRLRGARLARQLRDRPASRSERIHQAVRFAMFGLIGATGLVVNSAALWFFYHVIGWNHLVGASLATQVSTTWNFILVDAGLYRKRSNGTRLSRAIRFFLMNNVLLLARLPVLELLVARAGLSVLVANGITLVALFVVRFVLSDRAIFAGGGADTRRDPVRVLVDLREPLANGAVAGRKRSRYLTYRYDVAGVVRIGSQIMLPELEFFRAQRVADGDVDIAIRVGDVGHKRPRRRASMIESVNPTVISYEEHLGRLGANFRARIDGEHITIDVGPLLAKSHHVVYTNVLEPLLRFVMVSRDRMLLHSACVELDGVGVMLSALTDTGKTGTVLRLLREHGGKFLSDDMTIIDRDGNASWFPKPLTISSHTLRAVNADDLTRSEWRRLQIQSRLHSKSGRSFAMTLSKFNLPIMGINAITQILVPPPKYTADRLVSCQFATGTKVRELFIIERGTPRLARVDKQDALAQLLTNTDDAYGFPPFRYLAPAINIGSRDYHQLRELEREILSDFLDNIRVRALGSNNFSWADEIPGLLGPDETYVPEFATPEATSAAAEQAAVSGGAPASVALNGDGPAAAWAALLGDVSRAPNSSGNGSGDLATTLALALRGSSEAGDRSASVSQPVVAPLEPRRPRRSRHLLLYPGVPLAAITALAVVLRFWQLGTVGFNTDEAVYTGSAASLAGNSTLAAIFPVFRAHPLLFQTLLSVVLRIHDTDWTARAFAAVIGIATVGVTFALGRKLYGEAAGLVAALLLAVMPYEVIVSRQVLLDGLMTLCATAALYCVVRFAETGRLSWLLSCASAMSAAILTKETSAVLLGALYVFFALTPAARGRLRQILLASALIVAVVAIWPISLKLAGHTSTGQSYLLWQLFRRANHGPWFYFTVLPSWIGIAVIAAGLAGLVWLRRENTWRERLLGAWIVVPVLFFTLWPVKGFQYLLPISPVLAILAGRALSRPLPLPGRRGVAPAWVEGEKSRAKPTRRQLRDLLQPGRLAMGVLVACTVVSLAIPAWTRIQPSTSGNFLAGTGGMTGGREAGKWIQHNVPQGSRLLAVGPSVANVLEFYGNRPVSALSVSANPRDRNPSYTPVINPDLALRDGDFQYLVWDAYTAGHSSFFSAEVLRLIKRFNGVVVYRTASKVNDPLHPGALVPAVTIYQVHP